jgi:hypothetical protein
MFADTGSLRMHHVCVFMLCIILLQDPNEMGLLRQDWSTFALCRLNLLERINPAPTRFAHINSDEVCVAQWGTYQLLCAHKLAYNV